MEHRLTFPELSLVVLIGVSGSGKSSFALKHFKPTEVISSDYCRGLVSDDENELSATNDAFQVLHYIAGKRLARGKLTVVDATNVQPEARRSLVTLAREYHCLPVAIVLNLPEKLCHERNRLRSNRNFGPHVVDRQGQQLRRSLKSLKKEGFRYVYVLESPEEVEAAIVQREPLYNDLRHEHGPFDIIGDVHGCLEELKELLTKLGYEVTTRPGNDGTMEYAVHPPEGRKAVFLGDLVDRGPDISGTLRLVMGMVESGAALCLPGNHDIKLMRKLQGKEVRVTHGLDESLEQLEKETPEFREEAARFLYSLISHYVLDGGRLVVAHAGMKEEMQGRGSGKVRDFALYGETTGETDEFGLPIRYNWASEYRGKAMVVYGHTPVPAPEWLNNTINIDTGCVFGGGLTAIRYPEKDLVSVQAAKEYYQPARPFLLPQEAGSGMTAQQRHDELLDIEEVMGKHIIPTRLRGNVTILEENAAAALEVMSRFAANPKWLIYLPPTMSPSETSEEEGLLEHPNEAFSYFKSCGVPRVVCQEKHMGSRAVVLICKDEETAVRRFGVAGEGVGICYTRTGRRFFQDGPMEAEFLERVLRALKKANVWEDFQTDWVLLDCELMPWSVKAQELLREQYAAVGASARFAVADAEAALEKVSRRGVDIQDLLFRYHARAEMASRFTEAYRRYCWPVRSIDDLKLAPFHLLATEGAVHFDKDHLWHMETLGKICRADEGLLLATSHKAIDVTDEKAQEEGVRWWEELTGRGGEGMVVKPLSFIAEGKRGLVQPALKCRGREYLRIIYGLEYASPEQLVRLRSRALSAKRSLALREFALGLEALERFVRGEPLRRVHECVFGILALESEPVDPRL